MTKEQVERILEKIRVNKEKAEPLAKAPPPPEPAHPIRLPIAVLLTSGTVFEGMGFLDNQGDLHLSIERIAQAHHMKGRVSVFVSVDAIQAITEG